MIHRPLRGGFVALLAAVVGALSVAGPTASSPRRCANGYVGLTFDDGPSATSPLLLAALRANHLRATMFNQGDNAVARPQYVRDEQRAGMWVGNHSFTHPNLRRLGKSQGRRESARTQRAPRDATHRTPTLFRPPDRATSGP